MSGDIDKLFGYALFGVGAGVWFFFKGFRTLKRKRLIENTPTSKIRSLAMGLVEICGETVPATGTLKSPFTQAECVYYRYSVEEYRRSGKSSRWVTLEKDANSVPFFVRDETGAVLVEPDGAEIDIPEDFRAESGMGSDPDPRVKAFLQEQRIEFEGWLGANKKMRYIERFISPGNIVYVLGTAVDNPHIKEGSATDNAADIMISAGDHGQMFYISDTSEKECLNKHAWSIVGEVYGGIALTVASFGYALYRINMLFGWQLF